MKPNKQTLIVGIKSFVGGYLFFACGGIIFVALGLMPAGTIVAVLALLSIAGVPITAVSAQIMAIIGIAALISFPIAMFGAAWMEEGLAYFFGWKTTFRRIIKAGFEKLPIIGVPIGKTIG